MFKIKSFLFIFPLGVFLLSACSGGSSTQPVINAQPQLSASQPVSAEAYTLGAGDKLRIIVFGEEDLSGEFLVDDAGSVGMPLIGDVSAKGITVSQFENKVINSLKSGYLRDPKVSVEVLNYRPFFILGEVKTGGEYPYKSGLTVQDAVAIAGGYSYRANKKTAWIRRAGTTDEKPYNISNVRVLVFPGDNIRISERFF